MSPDPDPVVAEAFHTHHRRIECGEQAPGEPGWHCTRKLDHKGDHISAAIYRRWPRE